MTETEGNKAAPPARGMRLTERDRAILGLLQQDAWRTISEIAAVVGLSRATVKDRIDLMRERGVIKRFTVELEHGAEPDLVCETAFFLLRLRRPVCRIVYGTIQAWPELLGCWSIAGDLDMVVLVSASSNGEIERLRDRLARHPEVNRLQTLTVLRDWPNRARSLHPKAARLINEMPDVIDKEYVQI